MYRLRWVLFGAGRAVTEVPQQRVDLAARSIRENGFEVIVVCVNAAVGASGAADSLSPAAQMYWSRLRGNRQFDGIGTGAGSCAPDRADR